jgi:hypothetical protein
MSTTRNIILLAMLVVVSMTAQQVSDRAIVNQFTKTVNELYLRVDSAMSANDCAEIAASIEEMGREFAAHKGLLDRSLFPDDYSKSITNLRERLLVRQKDLGVIEAQIVRIADLEKRVQEFSGKISDLTEENDSLLTGFRNLRQAHQLNMGGATSDRVLADSLRTVIARLRQNLKERDGLIFALLDSLFLQYDKDVASMNDVEKQSVSVRLERRNVLTNIKKSIADNLKFLESTELSPNDYMEIALENQRFTSQWNELGPKLASIYLSGKQKKGETVLIDSMLSTWSLRVDQSTWKALSGLFEKGGVQVKPFANGDELTKSFSEFVDAEIGNAKKEPNDVQRMRFNTFNDQVWKTDIEPAWLPALMESGKISADQKAVIEKSFSSWRKEVTPIDPVDYVLVAVAIVVVLWSLTRRVRKKPLAEQS